MTTEIDSAQTSQEGFKDLSPRDLATVIRIPQLIKMLGLSRSTIYLRINSTSRYFDPLFPKPIRIGQKAIGWLLADVYAYLQKLKMNQVAG